jgi:hypothetical protein
MGFGLPKVCLLYFFCISSLYMDLGGVRVGGRAVALMFNEKSSKNWFLYLFFAAEFDSFGLSLGFSACRCQVRLFYLLLLHKNLLNVIEPVCKKSIELKHVRCFDFISCILDYSCLLFAIAGLESWCCLVPFSVAWILLLPLQPHWASNLHL